ncbi:MAG: FkbM family methyltransferase [Pseudomonadota bacterium]
MPNKQVPAVSNNYFESNQAMLDFQDVITHYAAQQDGATRTLAQSLLHPHTRPPLYYFGRNELSAGLHDVIPADGFIDDFAPSGTTWHAMPVVALAQLDKGSVIVNCVINAKPRTAFSRLAQAGFSQLLSYADLCRAMPEHIPLPDFVAATRADVTASPAKWAAIYAKLADSASRQVFNDVLRYRLTADHTCLNAYAFRPHEQYFEDFMHFNREVFVDAGGFDGDTTEQFCQRYPDYQKVYLFEPASANLTLAKSRLTGFRDIEFIEKGVSNESGTLYFNANQGSASAISDSGDSSIEVTTIDACVSAPVSFIKMDLEGWEINALTGARDHILTDHPKLAIAVYHRPSDFWGVFELIIGLRDDYQVYLRHYTESWTETVMFFLPAPATKN